MELEIQIKTEAGLRIEERQELDMLLADAFIDDPDLGYGWAQPTVHVMGWNNNQLASYAGILEREILAAGKRMLVAGISDVATRADCRQQGLARSVVQAAGEYLRKTGRNHFVMLFCNLPLVPFYQSCGYRLVDSPLFITSRGRRFQIGEIKMIMSLDETAWPDGEIDLLGLPW